MRINSESLDSGWWWVAAVGFIAGVLSAGLCSSANEPGSSDSKLESSLECSDGYSARLRRVTYKLRIPGSAAQMPAAVTWRSGSRARRAHLRTYRRGLRGRGAWPGLRLEAARPITGVAPATRPYLRGGYLDPAPVARPGRASFSLALPGARSRPLREPGARAPRDVTAALIQRTLRPTRVSPAMGAGGAGSALSTGAEPVSRHAPGCSRSACGVSVRPPTCSPPVSLFSAH